MAKKNKATTTPTATPTIPAEATLTPPPAIPTPPTTPTVPESAPETTTTTVPSPLPEVAQRKNGEDNPIPPVITLERVGTTGKRYESKTEPDSAYHLRNRSTKESPCKVVRAYCAENPTLARKDIITHLTSIGVDKNTAATQYSLWHAKNPIQIATPVELAPGTQPSPDSEVCYVAPEEGTEE